MTITILGLGPGNPEHLTRQAWELISGASEIYLRTSQHPTVAALPDSLVLHSFDELYETSDDFGLVYDRIAEQVIALGKRPQGVIYAVPGHPLVGESSVQRILNRARQEGLEVRLVDGLSFIEPVLSALQLDGLANLQLADATDLAAAHHPPLDPDRPALVGQLYSLRLAGEVKLTLMNAYPDDHLVTLVRAAGMADETTTTFPLFELDRGQQVDHLTALYVPPLPHAGGLPTLQETVARLRAPGGCPWDQEQSHESLRANLLEETYETLAALDAGDDEKLCEELGDLLMQIAMHTQIATEEGAFQFADLIGGIDAKLKRRHPHVFGDVQVRGTADVLRNWEAIKAGERQEEGHGQESRLAGVPAILPALARAQALGERAARAGFDWPDVDGVLDKLAEEVAEVRAAQNVEERAREMGDLLFTLVNVARWLDLDAESALRSGCDRFTRRYAAMERAAAAQGRDLGELSMDEKDDLWNQAKNSD
jgi:tetrapyrrole methylase family protein/MazG family protein